MKRLPYITGVFNCVTYHLVGSSKTLKHQTDLSCTSLPVAEKKMQLFQTVPVQ